MSIDVERLTLCREIHDGRLEHVRLFRHLPNVTLSMSGYGDWLVHSLIQSCIPLFSRAFSHSVVLALTHSYLLLLTCVCTTLVRATCG